ncbi:MAG: NitT/TauT family transport system substrate-binding protein [Streptosporangiaceae bacterium]|jgi:NitT/TauT family transport system substrate-binding protein|nr:NitT/TauT family transport system substrate-binding protein [Streptosporangiaceae bacterium]
MRLIRVRRNWLVAAGLATVLLTAACGGSSGAAKSSGTGPEKPRLTVAALPIVDDAPLFLAIKKGYFKQQGLTVTPEIIAQSTLALPDLLHGSVDIVGGGNYVSYFEGQAKGTFSLQVLVAGVACTASSFGVLAMPGSGITSPAGLAGKTIAVNLTNNIQTLTTNAVLKAAGVNTATVKYVAIPFPDMATALKAGRVDAISVVEPFLSGAEHAMGARQVMSECSGPTSALPLSGYFATRAWTQKYPRTARAFQRAMDRAQAFANSDPAAVKQILPTYTKITAQAAGGIHLGSFPVTLAAAQLQRVADLMHSGGLLASAFNVQPMLFH